MTAPTLPFDEIGIVLTTMTTGVQFLYFILVIAVNVLGILVCDFLIDKRMSTKDVQAWEYEWKELGLLSISSAIITMSLIEFYNLGFWNSMFFAWIMGVCFRPLLPEIAKISNEKIKFLINGLFGSK